MNNSTGGNRHRRFVIKHNKGTANPTGRNAKKHQGTGTVTGNGQIRQERPTFAVPKPLLRFLIGLASVICICVCGYFIIRGVGEARLRAKAQNNTPQLATNDLVESVTEQEVSDAKAWQEDWIRYNGKIYEYNDSIMTFLVMGIDKTGEVKTAKTGLDGGQADAIFLMVVNPDKEQVSLIGINRDTMVDINALDVAGANTASTAYAQIAVQHGYGDGKEQSCELMETAVSNLFYGLPINGYASINMDAIPALNDSIGGVDVTAIEDVYTSKEKTKLVVKEGTDIHLNGQNAYTYVRYRDCDTFESARMRLARQKQYLSAFVNTAKAETKQNITLPVSVYNQLSKYMVTDVTADELSYLVTEYIGYEMDPNGIYSLEGETKMGPISEEFYPDEDALVDLMIGVFYKEVEQ